MPDRVCRRLMLFLDGTWNQDDDKNPASNIVYLRERLSWGIAERVRNPEKDDEDEFRALPERFQRKGLSGVIFEGFEYIVHYNRGVGTGAFFDPIRGGVTGAGLEENIREAYRFLSSWFRPGDEIYVFGFSRGAFTARSLCGYLNVVGLLRSDACTKENEQRVWNYYQTKAPERLSGEWHAMRHAADGTSLAHDDDEVRVRALCVFDTVGALGIPASFLRRYNRQKYEFHDTEVNPLVDIQLHAVAIDEPRRQFEPAMWTKPKFKLTDPDKAPIEQAWFPGAHSDIGGGYDKWNQDEKGLSVIPLTWMLQRLQYHVATKPPIAKIPFDELSVRPNYRARLPFFTVDELKDGSIKKEVQALSSEKQHKPWAALSLVGQEKKRIINQIQLPRKKIAEQIGKVPFADPIGEMVHVCVLERFNLEKGVTIDKGKVMNFLGWFKFWASNRYRPKNLIAVIPYIAATYLREKPIQTPWLEKLKPVFTWKEIRVVGWDGMPLDPKEPKDVARVFELLPQPEAIRFKKMPVSMEAVRDIHMREWPPAIGNASRGGDQPRLSS